MRLLTSLTFIYNYFATINIAALREHVSCICGLKIFLFLKDLCRFTVRLSQSAYKMNSFPQSIVCVRTDATSF